MGARRCSAVSREVNPFSSFSFSVRSGKPQALLGCLSQRRKIRPSSRSPPMDASCTVRVAYRILCIGCFRPGRHSFLAPRGTTCSFGRRRLPYRNGDTTSPLQFRSSFSVSVSSSPGSCNTAQNTLCICPRLFVIWSSSARYYSPCSRSVAQETTRELEGRSRSIVSEKTRSLAPPTLKQRCDTVHAFTGPAFANRLLFQSRRFSSEKQDGLSVSTLHHRSRQAPHSWPSLFRKPVS